MPHGISRTILCSYPRAIALYHRQYQIKIFSSILDIVFGTYYMPVLAEYLASLSTPNDTVVTEQNVYEWGNQWLMSAITTTVAGMYMSR